MGWGCFRCHFGSSLVDVHCERPPGSSQKAHSQLSHALGRISLSRRAGTRVVAARGTGKGFGDGKGKGNHAQWKPGGLELPHLPVD